MTAGSKILVTAFAVAAMAVGIGRAQADIIRSGVFTSDHCTGGCGVSATNPGALLTVTDHQNGTLDFTIQTAPNYVIIGSGFQASFAFNLIGNPTITYSSIIPPGTYSIPGGISPQQNAGSLMVDGFGNFEYGIDVINNGFGNNAGSTLSFSISGTGLDITDLAELSTGGSPPAFFALDVAHTVGGVTTTGAIDISLVLTPGQQCFPGPCTTIPEPSSLAVFGATLIALGGISYIMRRRRKDEV